MDLWQREREDWGQRREGAREEREGCQRHIAGLRLCVYSLFPKASHTRLLLRGYQSDPFHHLLPLACRPTATKLQSLTQFNPFLRNIVALIHKDFPSSPVDICSLDPLIKQKLGLLILQGVITKYLENIGGLWWNDAAGWQIFIPFYK